MSLADGEFDGMIRFPADSPEVLKYLKGETVVQTGLDIPDGYVLIAADRFPLGFAKNKDGVLKNKYLSGWRYQ